MALGVDWLPQRLPRTHPILFTEGAEVFTEVLSLSGPIVPGWKKCQQACPGPWPSPGSPQERPAMCSSLTRAQSGCRTLESSKGAVSHL